MTALLTLDAKGETVTAEFYRSVIHSKARLTYTDVAAFFQGEEPGEEKVPAEVRPMLLVARKAAFALRWMRRGRGSLDFDLPDADLVLGETGDVVAIVKAVRNEAHRLIEEFMLAANEAVARHLVFVPTPAMYRVHDKPDERKLGDLRAVLEPLGYDIPAGRRPRQPGDLPGDPRPGRGQARGALRLRPRPARAEEGPLRPRLPRPLRPRGDVLRPLHLAHPALPRPRRPPGPLRVDRLAQAPRRGRGRGPRALARRSLDATAPSGSGAPSRPSARRSRGRSSSSSRKRVGEEFDAYVSAVVPFGLFITLEGVYADGLLPMDALEDDFYRYEDVEHRLVGTSTGRVFRLGDHLRVKLTRADFDKRLLDFRLAGASAPQRTSRPAVIERAAPRRPAPEVRGEPREREPPAGRPASRRRPAPQEAPLMAKPKPPRPPRLLGRPRRPPERRQVGPLQPALRHAARRSSTTAPA